MRTIQDTRLYELLAFLKPAHRIAIQEISRLSFVNYKKEGIMLLDNIIKHINSNNKSPLCKRKLISICSIKEENFNRLMSRLFIKTRQALYLLGIMDTSKLNIAWANFFIEHSLENNTARELEQLESILNKTKIYNPDFYLQKSKYHALCLSREIDNRAASPHLISMNQNLDAFYASSKLQLLCEYANRSRIIKTSTSIFTTDSIPTFLALLHQNDFFDSDNIKTYYYIYLMLVRNTEESYQNAAVQFKIYYQTNELPSDLAETFIAYLMNQCIQFMNKNIKVLHYADHYISYLELLEQEGYLLSNGQLRLSRFQGAIMAASISGKIKWMQKFVNNYGSLLTGDFTDFFKEIHEAYVNKMLGNVKLAKKQIEALVLPRMIDSLYAITYYRIAIEIHYADRDSEAVLKTTETLYRYIKRSSNNKNIASAKLERIKKFIRYTKKAINLPSRDSRRDKVRAKFKEERSQVAYATWLDSVL